MSIKEKWFNIPVIQIKNVYNEDLKTIYYELWLNGRIEGRYPLLESVLWRLSLMISEEALAVDFNEVENNVQYNQVTSREQKTQRRVSTKGNDHSVS